MVLNPVNALAFQRRLPEPPRFAVQGPRKATSVGLEAAPFVPPV